MNKKAYQKFIALVRALPKESLLAAANRCDGHTTFKPQSFLDAGLPGEAVASVGASDAC